MDFVFADFPYLQGSLPHNYRKSSIYCQIKFRMNPLETILFLSVASLYTDLSCDTVDIDLIKKRLTGAFRFVYLVRKMISFLCALAKWLSYLCKFHDNCNKENVNETCNRDVRRDVTAKIGWQRSHHRHPVLTGQKRCFYKGQSLTWACIFVDN